MATNKKLTAQATKEIADYAVAKCDEHNADLKAAIEVLTRKEAEREEKVRVARELPVFWTEGLAAVARVMEREFGYNTTTPNVNPFNGEKIPISYLSIQVGPNEQVNVTNSDFNLPGTSILVKPAWDGPFDFKLMGLMKRKDEPTFQSFADAVLAEVAANSIYRSKMLELSFEYDGDVDVLQAPHIVQPPTLLPCDLILPKLTAGYINTELFKFVTHLETNRAHGLNMNRKVLLAGSYGTGKTLTAGVLSNLATKVGWTVLWLKLGSGVHDPFACMRKAMDLAQHYGPCILFQEDFDEHLGRERDSRVNEVVNTMDNLLNKDGEFLFVTTTNNPESLDPVTLRRFDLLVSFELPDAEAAVRLVRLYAGPILLASVDLGQVGELLKGKAPSIIASAVESARRAAIYRAVEAGTTPSLEANDIVVATHGRTQHVALIERPSRVDRNPTEQIADAIVKAADVVVTGKANGHLLPATSLRP